MKNIKIFISIIKKSPILLIISILCFVFLGLTPGISLYASKILTDYLSVCYTNIELYYWNHIIKILAVLFSIWIAENIFSSVEQNMRELFGRKNKIIVSTMIAEKNSTIPLEEFENGEYYDALHLAKSNIQSIDNFIEMSLLLLSNIIKLFSLGIITLNFNPIITIIIIFASIIDYIVKNNLDVKNWSWMIRSTPENRKLGYFENVLSSRENAKEIKVFNAFNFFFHKREKTLEELFRNNLKLTYKNNNTHFVLGVINNILIGAFTIFVIFNAANNQNTIGDVLLAIGSITLLQNTLKSTASQIVFCRRFWRDTKYIIKLLNYESKFSFNNIPDIQDEYVSEKGIRLVDVCYRYPSSDNFVLMNVSMFIPVNSIIALVGPNGAGKTTLVKIILGMYRPTSGKVYIDGICIENYSQKSLDAYFSAIFQDFVCYHSTVSENISFTDEPNIAKLNEVLTATNLQEFVSVLPSQEEAMLGIEFGGQDLSLGQWQRIALARALYKNASCIILDEPTASLDAKLEYQLISTYHNIMKNKTSIIISHRFSSIKFADLIIVLDAGQVSETGTHDSLMENNGLYSVLYELQQEKYK